MATFVLIPGMCHGGRRFEEVTRRLRDVPVEILTRAAAP